MTTVSATADERLIEAVLGDLAASPSPYHAVARAAALLDEAGFTGLDPAEGWPDVDRGYVAQGGSLVAWHTPQMVLPPNGFAIVGAHTDSPNLRLKPNADTGAVGWKQLAVEVYGGVLVNSWLDRDLGVSGRLVLRGGEVRLVRVERALARIPQLAIHLDREVTDRGLLLDKQQHLTPIWGLGAPSAGEFAEFVAAEAGVTPGEVVAWELMLHDLTPPARLGRNGELVASARIDNLYSSFCAVRALAAAGPGRRIAVVALFDHEEVGSASTTGAAGPVLEGVLERLVPGGGRAEVRRAYAASACVSADMAHGVHPNYAERHEPGHRPVPNGGPVVKVNANQRYATDAVTAGWFVECCERARVPHQVFVSRNNMPCGSTIGPITATRLGIPTVDVGGAMLSMHSARELAGARDVAFLTAAFGEFFVS
ncbi:MAG: M18 family aminopeptidase [Acidimicrobiales bacterium]